MAEIEEPGDYEMLFTEADAERASQQIVDMEDPYPPAIIRISEERLNELKGWLQHRIQVLVSGQGERQKEWAGIEDAYRALPEAPKTVPFEGACNDVVPVIAMAIDPIHARLMTGIFKNDPVFKIKALKKNIVEYVNCLEQWIEYYQKHQLRLRDVAAPRVLECAKLGTCVFKTVYDHVEYKVKTYDTTKPGWPVIEKTMKKFNGPRVFGVSVGDFLFPADYQFLQDCPIVAQRIRMTPEDMMIAQASKKLTNVEDVKNFAKNQRTQLETAREDAAKNWPAVEDLFDVELYECWFRYDIDGDGIPESLVATYHYDSNTFLQLRYNWYFHQEYPFTIIPYMQVNDSLLGLGIGEMVRPFQESITKMHQMARDNAYLANIRMFIVKRNSPIEETPRLYAGRCFFVDDPKSDFIPFQAGDIYNSTLTEQQNMMGLIEKRTGVSDYLVGRESPIVGTRATATSTLALIKEGTARVEAVMENFRIGFSDIMNRCNQIWIQYGTGGIEDIVFKGDEEASQIRAFYESMGPENIHGAMAFDLTATDASNNKQALQQIQLQLIQIMMQYLEKVLAAGQMALQAQMQSPQTTAMIADVMTAAREMFKDLLTKYDVKNPEDYLPDLTRYLNAGGIPPEGQGGEGYGPVGPGGAGIPSGLPPLGAMAQGGVGPGIPFPPQPGGVGPGVPGAGPGFGV